MTREFRAGDKVKYYPYGDRKFVLQDSGNEDFPIYVQLDQYTTNSFTRDGKHHKFHTHPLLTLVEPVKGKKILKWYKHWYFAFDEFRCSESDKCWEDFADICLFGGRYKHIKTEIVEEFEVDCE
jgi:hypothetical protein